MKTLILLFMMGLGICKADTFVPDLADNSKATSTGTFAVEAGVCAAVCEAGKLAMDLDSEGRKYDFAPSLIVTLAGLLIHSQYWTEGGWNSRMATQEQLWESAGCFSILTF
jgi:hypothetical protein